MSLIRISNKKRREKRVRKKILHNLTVPRLTVNRSNKYLTAQVIDEAKRKTIVSVHEKELAKEETKNKTKIERAKQLGGLLAKKAVKHKVTRVVFDRGSYKYHGRVAAFAAGAREGGLTF